MKKVLICDDDEGIIEIIKIMLEEAGYRVLTLSSGKAILKKVADYKPNLILLDIWMPGIGGEEITKILKRDKTTKSIPIIVVSALNDTQRIARDCGADDFLPKPFEMNNLLEMAQKYTA